MDTGQRLFEARKRRGLALEDISRTTKIPVSVLYAIERNDEKHLPQKFFTRAFIRTYAAQVGLNADELLDEYVEEVEAIEPLSVPVPDNDATSSRSFVLVALAAACSIYFGYVLQQTPRSVPNGVESAVMEPVPMVRSNDRGDITLPAAVAVVEEVVAPPRAALQNVRHESAAAPMPGPIPALAEESTAAEPAAAESSPVISDAVLPQPDVAVPTAPPVEQF